MNWNFRQRLPIQDHMAEVLKKTIDASKNEAARLRRKLEKMKLGG